MRSKKVKVKSKNIFKKSLWLSLRGGLPTWQSQIQVDASKVFAIASSKTSRNDGFF